MPQKYHVNAAGKLAVCKATQRACRYGSHFDTVEEAKANFFSLLEQQYAPNPVTNPVRITPDKTVAGKARIPVQYPYSPLHYPTISFSGEHDYDYYGPENGEEPEDYNRNYVYSGLTIDTVDIKKTLMYTLGFRNEADIPDDLIQLAEDNGWDETSSWNIYGSGGYYGEEIQIDPPEGMQDELRAWFYNLPNASDSNDILSYVRRDGTETSGSSPFQAVKKMVSETHPEFDKKVAKAKGITFKPVTLDAIKVTAKRLREAKPLDESYKIRGQKYYGVLLETGPNQYELVDGARRLKHFMEHNPRRKPNFLILKTLADPVARPGGARRGW